MIRTLTAYSMAAFIGLTSVTYAQETTPEAAPEVVSEPAVTVENQLDMGQQIVMGPQIGDRYSKESVGDWDLACIKSGTEVDPCSLIQILKDSTGNPTAEVTLFRIAGAGQAVAGFTIIVPLETSLPAQLQITVDGGLSKRYIYSYCNQIGCIAQIGLTVEDVASYKRGSKATLTLVPALAPTQVIDLNMSLSGFTAGYEKVDVVQN